MTGENVESALRGIREELALLRNLVSERQPSTQRSLYKMGEAAKLLGVGRTKMAELVKSGVILTTPLDGREMVPASEIARLAHVDPPRKSLTPKAQRLADSLKKIRHPIPGAAEAVLRVRNAKRPRAATEQIQDPAALRATLKKKR